MEVLLQIIENVFEPEDIFRSRFAEGFVRLQHCASLLLLLPGGGFSGRFTRQLLAFGRRGAVAMNIEKLVKPEPVKQFAAAPAAVNDVQVSMTEFLEPQGHASHGSHEGGIHHRAVAQVDDELAVTAVDHLAGKFLEVPAVQKVALTFDPNPDGGAVYPNLNRRFHCSQ